MAKVAGSIWVEGNDLHFIDQFNREWYYPGIGVVAVSGAKPGSLWVNTQYIYYVNEAGNTIYTIYAWGDALVPIAARQGSVWIGQDNQLHWTGIPWEVQPGNYRYNVRGHNDTAPGSDHVDAHQDSLHTDIPHTDVAHSDIPGGPHQDGHNDVPHQDHTDSSHSDTHSDVAHSDSHDDTQQSQISPCSSGWTQTAHADHQDGNLHQDLRGCHHDNHSDSHGDSHGDSHSDVSHKDQAAKNSHGDFTDTSHTNIAHVDTAHVDVAHSDAHQDTHTDTPHGDLPIYVGY